MTDEQRTSPLEPFVLAMQGNTHKQPQNGSTGRTDSLNGARMNAVLKVNPRKLPVPILPPTRAVKTIVRPDKAYETIDYASQYESDKKIMDERSKRAAESTRRTYAVKNAYTPEQENEIIELYKSGMRTVDIAEKVGRTKTAIKQKIEKLRKEQGIQREVPLKRVYIKRKPESEIMRRNHYTPAQDAVIKEMKSQGKTFREIADQIGKSPEAVRCRWYRILGIK